MRQFVYPFAFLLAGCVALAGCTGGSASPTNPTGAGPVTDPNALPDSIVGDGELPGSGGGEEGTSSASDKSASPMAPSAGMGSSGSSSGSSGSSGMSSGSGASAGDDDDSGDSVSSSGGSSGTSGSGGSSGPNGGQGAGVLTAGTWDDNKNFSFFDKFRTSHAKDQGALSISPEEAAASSRTFGGSTGSKTVLDVSLVIDTTGSMGDEIAYLQREFTSLVGTIQAKYPQAQQRWSLVLYKDTSDSYLVKWFDFRSDTGELQQKLMTASASGGGDFPEAPDQAIDIANRLSWRRDPNVARVMFWVADAPHHDADAPRMTASVKAARDKGIHIYPVASSGVDEFTEYTMRQTAQLTGGRYMFLTDDSGVGGAHEEPTVPCYFVTKLDKAVLRMVDVELSGSYREPTSDEVIRTSGNPQSGICKVSSGTVSIY